MASRLYDILRKDVFSDIETGPWPCPRGRQHMRNTLKMVNTNCQYVLFHTDCFGFLIYSVTSDIILGQNQGLIQLFAHNTALCIRWGDTWSQLAWCWRIPIHQGRHYHAQGLRTRKWQHLWVFEMESRSSWLQNLVHWVKLQTQRCKHHQPNSPSTECLVRISISLTRTGLQTA